jgi:hypothetical protein
MDRLALRLMWIVELNVLPVNGRRNELMEYHSELITGIIARRSGPEPWTRTSRKEPDKSLREALEAFGHTLLQVRRRLTVRGKFEKLDADASDRILSEASCLRESAARSGNTDVVLFCDSLADFMNYVNNNHLLADPRVFGFIEGANLTIQTVVGGGIVEERDSLGHLVGLLGNPAPLFRQIPE